MADQAAAHRHPLSARRAIGRLDAASSWSAPAQLLGQSVLFDNKAGASGMIGAEFVKNQPVDHHTFLTTTTAMVCITRHLQPIPFDPETRHRPGVAHDDLVGRLRRASVGAGQDGRGVRGLCQGQSRQDQLRLAGPRHHHPPVRRDALPRGRHPDDPRALSRQRAGDQRTAGGRDPGAIRPDHAAAHQGGQAARARHPGRGAPSGFPRHADPAGDRATARTAAIPGSASSPPSDTSPEAIARLDKAIAASLRTPDIVDQGPQWRHARHLSQSGGFQGTHRQREPRCSARSSRRATSSCPEDGRPRLVRLRDWGEAARTRRRATGARTAERASSPPPAATKAKR